MQITLKDILTEEFIQQFQYSFAFATGFGVVFVDFDGNHIGEGSNFSKFCQEINRTKKGAQHCANTNRKAIRIAIESKKPSIYICHAGLINIEIPLTYDGEYIGALTAGQVLCSEQNEYLQDNKFDTLPWLKTQEAKEFLKDIKILTKQQIEATAILLENIANYIIQTEMYNKLQRKLLEEDNLKLEFEKKQIEMEHQLKLAELDALQKQITPHFMFNVISSISRLISLGDYKSAIKMLDSFSIMLRYSMEGIKSTITLEQELKYIESYLEIQKHRFSNKLEYKIEIQEDMRNIKIPYFSIQPLIENSIIHGLLPLKAGGTLNLICKKFDNYVSIDIIDDGAGISEDKIIKIMEKISSNGNKPRDTCCVGLKNCYRRFKLIYGDNFKFSLDSVINKGTKVTIKIRQSI